MKVLLGSVHTFSVTPNAQTFTLALELYIDLSHIHLGLTSSDISVTLSIVYRDRDRDSRETNLLKSRQMTIHASALLSNGHAYIRH